MTRSPFRPLVALAALLFLMASCLNPSLSHLAATSGAVVAPGDAQLVFSFPQARAVDPSVATLADVGFLTVRVTAKDETVRYGQATKAADGTFAVEFKGMIAGVWDMRVQLYDSAIAPQLLFYTEQPVYIAVGKTTTPSLEVYKAGNIGPIAIVVNNPVSVAVGDALGLAATAAAERTVRQGSELTLEAVVWGDAGTALVNQKVTWESNSPAAEVTGGHVKAKGVGKAVITARSVLGSTVLGQFYLNILSPVLGLWQSETIVDTYTGEVMPAPGLYLRFLEGGTVEEYQTMEASMRYTGTWTFYEGAVDIVLTHGLNPATGTMEPLAETPEEGIQGYLPCQNVQGQLALGLPSDKMRGTLRFKSLVDHPLTGGTFLEEIPSSLTEELTLTAATYTPTDAAVPAVTIASSDPAVKVTQTTATTWTLTPVPGASEVPVTVTVRSLADLSVLTWFTVTVPAETP